ncbi:MAG TPA: M48 family metalloprotease [Acidobacteriota bacterium]|nr:M48 family metalloprotease [Acidobacteriota bacterium]
MKTASMRIASLFLAAACIIAVACVKNPVTGKRQLVLISESQEIAMGRETHPEILARFGVVEDKALQEYFSRIGHELARVSHRPGLDWHFTVVDSPVVNAFAVPGGYIYLTRGILQYMNNEAEMAAVLGHEIAHVTARHSVTQLSQSQLMNLGLGLGSMFSTRFQQVSGLAQMGLGILSLKYSRDHERESDQLGLEYMARIGYDPQQMSSFFQVFETMREESGQTIPSWLSTHPAPPDRIQQTLQEATRIRQASPGRTFKINTNEFLSRLDGLVYGDNPREGFVEKGMFIHPDLRFQMAVPSGWRVENTKSFVAITEPGGGAVIELTLAPPEAGTSPAAIAQKIGSQQGIRLLSGNEERINGKPAFVGIYSVQSDQGIIGAMAAFISHGGRVYQLSGLSPELSFSKYRTFLNATIRSFRELTDRRLLDVQPDRMNVVRARQGDTLRSMTKSMNQERVSLEALSRINRIDPDQPLAAGTMVKLVQLGRR